MRSPDKLSNLPSPDGRAGCVFSSGSICRLLLLFCFALFSITGGRFSYVIEHAHGGAHESGHLEHHPHGESQDSEHQEHNPESGEEGEHHHHLVSAGAELWNIEVLTQPQVLRPITLCSAEFLHDVGPDGPVFEITKPPQVA